MASSSTDNHNDGDDDGWCTIESDPGVFTSLVETLGVKNVEFTELWSLDDEALLQLVRPLNYRDDTDTNTIEASFLDEAAVYGLIFLFKWQSSNNKNITAVDHNSSSSTGTGRVPLTEEEIPPGLYFARQTTHNACATQAILSVLFNAASREMDGDENDNKMDDGADAGIQIQNLLSLGKTLTDFKSFTQHLPPDIRGEAIGSSEEIRTAHNSYGKPSDDAFLNDPSFRRPKRFAKDDDDVFHFVAYVPCPEDGCVYELDGLKPGPIRLGSYKVGGGGGGSETTTTSTITSIPSDNSATTMEWLRVARDAIQSRLADYPMGEIKFNLMAMVQDRQSYYTHLLKGYRHANNITPKENHDGPIDALPDEYISSSPYLMSLRDAIHAEEEKRMQWKIEKERRQYNYLPFCVQLLRSLAGSGKFQQLVAEARKKHASSLEESRKRRRA